MEQLKPRVRTFAGLQHHEASACDCLRPGAAGLAPGFPHFFHPLAALHMVMEALLSSPRPPPTLLFDQDQGAVAVVSAFRRLRQEAYWSP